MDQFAENQSSMSDGQLTQEPQVSKPKKRVYIAASLFIITFGLGTGVLLSFFTSPTAKLPADKLTIIEESGETPKITPKEIPSPPDVDTFESYADSDLKLSFSYPAEWGDVTKHQKGDADRDFYVAPEFTSTVDYTFSNVPLVVMPLMGKSNSYLVNQSACYLRLGLLNATLDQSEISEPYATDWEQSEVGKGNNYTTYSRAYEVSSERIIMMNYSVSSVVSKSGYCNGLTVYGQQRMPADKEVWAVQFIWGDTAASLGENQQALSLSDLEVFKQNPDKEFGDEDVADLRAFLDSITVD